MSNILKQLDAAEKAAMPGPWEFRATKDSSGIQFVVAPNAPKSIQGFEFIAADCSHKANGELIALSRSNIRALLDVAKAARYVASGHSFLRDDCGYYSVPNFDMGLLNEALAKLRGEE